MDTDITQMVLDYLVSKDVDAAVVNFRKEKERQVKFSENEIDTFKIWDHESLDFFMAKDGKTYGAGFAIPDTEQQIKSILDNYYKILQKLEPNPLYKGIFEGPQPTYQSLNSNKVTDPKFDSISLETPDLVRTAIDASLKAGSKRNAGILFFGETSRHLMTSKGIDASSSQTYWDFNIRAMDEGTDHTGAGNMAGSILSEAGKSLIEIGKQAGETCKKMNNAKQGTAGKYDVILSPSVSAQVLSALPNQANPIGILFGFSGLKDKMGEQLAPDFVTITDKPMKENSNVYNPFDYEGVPTQNLPIFEKGILKNFVHNTSTAIMFDAKSTGNSFLGDFGGGGLKILAPGSHSLYFEPGSSSLDDLISFNTKPVVYIKNSWYMRYTSPIEGIFSTVPRDGMFLIKNGEWQPIKKLRISENLYNVMKNIQAVGNDTQCLKWWDEYRDWFPHVRIADVNLTAATK